MALCRPLLPVCLALLLSGCFQVELKGPVAGSTVRITDLRTGDVIIGNLLSSDETSTRASHGDESWNNWTDNFRLFFLGNVDIPTDQFKDNTLYLVTASGGTDMDNNVDRIVDDVGVKMQQDLHAIMSGAQLKQEIVRVSLLSEAAYQNLQFELDELSDTQILAKLDDYGKALVGDINEDGTPNYADLLAWSQSSQDFPYKGPEIFLERLSRAFESTLYSEDVIFFDSVNVVEAVLWKPARPMAQFADILVTCAGFVTIGDICKFGALPLIGQNSSTITVEDIMNRVVVSHDWMEQRFEQLLHEMPEDVLLLFRSVSSVVIDANIRPAFYSPVNASIYLDPDYIWVQDWERQTISTEPDYRAAFAGEVSFADLARFVKNNAYAFESIFEPDANGSRELDDVVALASNLLFHELAHAGDVIPPGTISYLSPADTALDLVTIRISDVLTARWPLFSPQLFGVADVLYRGKPASFPEANYTASQIGDFFALDRASDLYSFSSQFEDAAMLFEEAMMAIHFDMQRDIAFTTTPPPDDPSEECSNYRVGWGVRGRITAPQVLPRVNWVVGQLLPEREYESVLAGLPAPQAMSTDKDWCENLFLSRSTASGSNKPGATAGSKKLVKPLPRFK